MKRAEINPKVPSKIADSLRRNGERGCCTFAVNLLPDAANDQHMTALLRCRVCGRGHRYMFAETGFLGVVR